MYTITLVRRDGDIETSVATATAADAGEIPAAARTLATDHDLPTGPIETSPLLRSARALRALDQGCRITVGLTAPENPTVPDNLIRDGITVERTTA